MDLQFLFSFTWLAILGVVIALSYLNAQGKREEIEHHLTRLGASDIKVSFRLFDFDKTNYTYNVAYTDRAGQHQQTVCKVRGGFWQDNTLYWKDAPRLNGQTMIVSASPTSPPTSANLAPKSDTQLAGTQLANSQIAGTTVDAMLQDVTSVAQVYAQSADEKDRLISELIIENARLRVAQNQLVLN